MKNILIIDSSKMEEIRVEVRVNGNWISEVAKQKLRSQVLLGLIDKVLKKGKIKKEDLDEIKVSTGPGSFTGIRVGVSVANALAYSLKIPVNGKEMEVDLQY